MIVRKIFKRTKSALKILCLLNVLSFLFFVGCQSGQKTTQSISLSPAKLHPRLQMFPVPIGQGVNIHFYRGKPQDFNMLQQAGIGIVRMDISWASAEKEPGKYNFSRYDRLVHDLEQRKIRLLFIIDYGNPLYDDGLAPHTDSGRAASARFCSALAKHYAGRDIIWELWNEPNQDHFWHPKTNVRDYMKWCKAVVPAIRQADSTACIIGPAVSAIDIPFLENCFEAGLLHLVDGVSVHPYRNVKRSPETTLPEYHQLKQLIDFYRPAGKEIPIISGEWGYSTVSLSEEIQAEYLARQWLTNLSFGIPVSIWYDWHDDGQDPNETEHHFGTVTYDYRPKPAYRAMKTLTTWFRNFRPVGRIGLGKKDDYFVLFRKVNELRAAMWTTSLPHSIDFGDSMAIEASLDFTGAPAQENFNLAQSPVFISIARPFPKWLNLLVGIDRLPDKQKSELAFVLAKNSKSEQGLAKELRSAQKSESLRLQNSASFLILQLAGKIKNQPSAALPLYQKVLTHTTCPIYKEQALSEIASIGSEKSLGLVSGFLAEPRLAPEASNYLLNLAFKVAAQRDFKRAEELLLTATRVSGNRYQAERIFRRMRQLGWKSALDRTQIAASNGFVTQWWVAGPFPNAGKIAELKAYFPEKTIDFAQQEKFGEDTAKWQKVKVKNIWGIVSLAEMFGEVQEAAYFYTEIKLPDSINSQFKIGSNDGVVCWVNGQKVHQNLIGRVLTVDEDVFPVSLRKGTNRILLKVPNRGANWEACLRICDKNGLPLDLTKKIGIKN